MSSFQGIGLPKSFGNELTREPTALLSDRAPFPPPPLAAKSPMSLDVFRITGIPKTTTLAELSAALSEEFSSKGVTIDQRQTTICPSPDGRTQAAIVQFSPGAPEEARGLPPGQSCAITLAGVGEVHIDKDFVGLTQMYPTSGKIKADVIAVSGFTENPYRAWTWEGDAGARREMWLRHYLAEDLPQCRTMIYGFDPNVAPRADFARKILWDCAWALMLDMRKARESHEEDIRPVIFIGHGWGAIVIAETLIKVKETQEVFDNLFEMTRATILFGIPYRSILIDELFNIDERLGESLERNYEPQKRHLQKFIDHSAKIEMKIVYFKALGRTRRLRMDEDGVLSRCGSYFAASEEKDTIFNLSASNATILEVQGSYVSLVRFRDQGDPTYKTILNYLQEYISMPPKPLADVDPFFGPEYRSLTRGTNTPAIPTASSPRSINTPEIPTASLPPSKRTPVVSTDYIRSDQSDARASTTISTDVDAYKLATTHHTGYVVHNEEISKDVWKESIWDVQGEVGHGSAGSVHYQRERRRGELRAVKMIRKPSEGMTQELRAMIELTKYDHLFVKLFGWYLDQSAFFIFLAMEYMKDGDLARYMNQHQISTTSAKTITTQILNALGVMHGKNFYHRDIKPKNILIACVDPIWVKIADFGISKQEIGTSVRTACGTNLYCAPENMGIPFRGLLHARLPAYALDIWSLGIVVHELLTSKVPFAYCDESMSTTEQLSGIELPASTEPVTDLLLLMQYCKEDTEFPNRFLEESGVDADGVAFVKDLLTARPPDRPTAREMLDKPWLMDAKGY